MPAPPSHGFKVICLWLCEPQDRELYGDGWTPLMAAAVGGRVAIARQLLGAAGPELAAELVAATNRYGGRASRGWPMRSSFAGAML